MYCLLDLPPELLVLIILFLSSRDIIVLQYVSNSIRVFTETPLVWRKFVWTCYCSREKVLVVERLKVYGNHIRHLSFTNGHRFTSNDSDLMLANCANVINLTLLMQTPLNKFELEKILQNLKHLKKLEISLSEDYYPASTLRNSNLTEVTLFLGKGTSFPRLHDYDNCFLDYISAGYKPQYVNIVQDLQVETTIFRRLLRWWSDHLTRNQYKPPGGYTAHFKLYGLDKVPFRLSPTLPQFHIQFSLIPLVLVSRSFHWCVLGQRDYILKLNHCSCSNHSCNCVVVNASVNENAITYYESVASRPSQYGGFKVNEFGVIKFLPRDIIDKKYLSGCVINACVDVMKNLLSKDLEQLTFLIPNLQRLDLSYCNLSADNMRGLQAVAINCHNLKGLRLKHKHAANSCRNLGLKHKRAEPLDVNLLWDILSGMKLTHLSIEHCLIRSVIVNNRREMVNLCATLQAIEIGFESTKCYNSSSKDLLGLSQFSSLQYCMVSHYDSYHSDIFQIITSSCKKLKCLIVQPNFHYQHSPVHPPTGISLSSTCNNNLEQLFIDSKQAIVSDEFMKSVSAHGGLTHVGLEVAKITENGVGILIDNSPRLIELSIGVQNRDFDPSILNKKYQHREFVTVGASSYLTKNGWSKRITFMYSLFSKNLKFIETDFFSLL